MKILEINKWYFFLGLCLIIVSLNYISQNYIFQEKFYYEVLGEQLSYDRIKDLISQKAKYEWLGYAFTPIYYLLKFLSIAFCIKTGLIFFDIKISWGKILNWLIKLETIFLIPSILSFVWFSFIKTDYSYEDMQFFYPLSLVNLFEPQELNKWFVYPLQLLNVFELVYWFALSKLFAMETKKKFWKSFEIILYTYGLGLIVWVVFVMFLSVNFS